MTLCGGQNGLGVIFSYDIAGNTCSDLHDFITASGSRAYGSLIQASDGKLYGMTFGGGLYGYGVIFSYDITDSLYTVLVDFDETNNGRYPKRELMQASNGKLYGTTFQGGLNGYGVAFSYDITSNNFTKLIDFNSVSTGGHPECDILEAVLNITQNIPAINDTKLFSLSPNPATTNITITSGAEKQSIISIYNMQGEIIQQQTTNTQTTNIDISSLSHGMYFVKVQTEKGVEVKKIIKE